MRVVGYVLLAALGVLALLLLAAVIRTLCMKKKTSDYTPHPDAAREREYAEKLSRMVAYETVSPTETMGLLGAPICWIIGSTTTLGGEMVRTGVLLAVFA